MKNILTHIASFFSTYGEWGAGLPSWRGIYETDIPEELKKKEE